MRIVILSPAFFEGLDYQENALVKYYEKHGHEVHLITSTDRSIFEYVERRHDRGIASHRYKLGSTTIYRERYAFNFLGRIQRFADIEPILKRVAPDLIFARGAMLNVTDCVRYIKRHPDCKMVMDFHGDYSNSGKNLLSRRILHGVLNKHVVDRARPYLSRIFPVTPGSAKFLHELYGVPHGEMELLPLGADIDLAEQVRARGARAELRQRYGIERDSVVVFTGGKLTPLKRTELLIEAFAKMNDARLHLVVVGDAADNHAGYKRLLLDSARDRPNIHFTGWLNAEEIYKHLDLSDIAAFPASQSILWQQAIAMGLPLVIGDTVGGGQDPSYLNLYGNIAIADQKRPLSSAFFDTLKSVIDNKSRRMSMAA